MTIYALICEDGSQLLLFRYKENAENAKVRLEPVCGPLKLEELYVNY